MTRHAILIIDMLNDFAHPDGALLLSKETGE